MAKQDGAVAALVSLVGLSPIPILAGDHDFGAGAELHVLVCSKTSKGTAEIVQAKSRLRCEVVCVEEEHNPHSTVEVITALRKELGGRGPLALNCTGGAKAMLPGGIRSLQPDDQVWYLNEVDMTWIGQGREVRPSSYRVTLDLVASLHGLKVRQNRRAYQMETEELRGILTRWLSDQNRGQGPNSISLLADSKRRKTARKDLSGATGEKLAKGIQEAKNLLEALLGAAKREFPHRYHVQLEDAVAQGLQNPAALYNEGSGWQRVVRDAACFLSGFWLEDLTAESLRPICEPKGLKVYSSTTVIPLQPPSVEGKDSRQQREADVIVVQPQGVILVSVTTSQVQKLIRQKAEEALQLRKMLGGSGGKAVVVSAGSDETIQNIGSLGEQPHTLRILGLETLKLLAEGRDEEFADRVLFPRSGRD